MPDAIQPVGSMIQPPDPMRGINTLSGIIGLQQQRQQLQTGQYLQQTAAAAAAANQQNTKEKMGLAKLLQDPKGNGILDDNNQPTPNAQAIIMGVAPTTGAEHYDNIVKAAQSKVAYNTSVNNLNASERAEIGSAMLARLYDPDAKPADVTGALDAVLAAKTGTPVEDDYRRIIGTQKQILNHTASQPSGQIAPPGQEQWRRAGIGLATALSPQLAKPDTSGVNLVGAHQPGATSPVTGGFTASGPPIRNVLGPTDMPGYKAQVASATEYAGGGSAADVARANEVSSLAQPARATIRLTQQVDQLAQEINSGHLAAMTAGGANYLGFSSVAEARTQLQKDLGQLRGAVASRAGSDQRASEILEGYPTDTTPENTIHAAMDYIRGSARQNIARNQLLERTGRPGFQQADSAMTSRVDPLMHEFMSLTPEQRPAFYRRNFQNPQEAQKFKDSVKAVSQ